jgi:hypothetical protein
MDKKFFRTWARKYPKMRVSERIWINVNQKTISFLRSLMRQIIWDFLQDGE